MGTTNALDWIANRGHTVVSNSSTKCKFEVKSRAKLIREIVVKMYYVFERTNFNVSFDEFVKNLELSRDVSSALLSDDV